MRKNFCEEANLDLSSVKFCIDGQRLHDNETLNSLGLANGDIIEAYMEMKGGGWPKQNIYNNVGKIQEILDNNDQVDMSTDDELSDEGDESKHPKVIMKSCNRRLDVRDSDNASETFRSSLDENKVETESMECGDQLPIEEKAYDSSYSDNVREDIAKQYCNGESFCENTVELEDQQETSDRVEIPNEDQLNDETENNFESFETDEEHLELMDVLRQEYENGTLNEKSAFDIKIIHFLKLPTLAPVEKTILKCLVERRNLYNAWLSENTLSCVKQAQKPKKRRLFFKYSKFQNINRIR